MGAHLPDEDLRRLREAARELVRSARPTAEERREIRRLAREVTRRSVADVRARVLGAHRLTADAQREAWWQLRDSWREVGREIGRALRDSLRWSEGPEPPEPPSAPEPPSPPERP